MPGHRELLEGQLFDVVVQGVDHFVPVGQDLGRLAVAGQQGIGGSGDRLPDEGEQLQHLPVDLLEGVIHASHRTRAGRYWTAGEATSTARHRGAGTYTGPVGSSCPSGPPPSSTSPTITRGPEPHER